MKRVFENPEISINRFITENVITTSGYETKVEGAMTTAGVSQNNMTRKSFSEIFDNLQSSL